MFWLWFPGLFLYNFFLASGHISPFLSGGGVSTMTALSLPLFFTSYVFSKDAKLKFGRLEIVFITIFVFAFLLSIIYFVLGKPIEMPEKMFSWSINNLLVLFTSFLSAYAISSESKIFRRLWIFTFISISILIISNVNWEYGLLNVSASYTNEAYDKVGVTKLATYQFYARLYAPMSIIAISLLKGNLKRILFIMLAITCTIFIGSRTEMLIMILVFPFYWFATNAFKPLKVVTMFSLLICGLVLAVIFNEQLEELVSLSSRLSTLLELSSDASLNERDVQLQYSINEIKESPLFGQYGSYTSLGGVGNYPHNILSAWHNLGLIGISLYVTLFILFLFVVLKQSLIEREDFYTKAGITILIFSFIALFFAKEYSYPLTGLGIGLISRRKGFK